MSTEKGARLGHELQRILAREIHELVPPGLIVTITMTDVSPSGQHTGIFFTVFPETEEVAVLKLLRSKNKELRSVIARELPRKYVPDLQFKIDQGEKKRHHIDELLRDNSRGLGGN